MGGNHLKSYKEMLGKKEKFSIRKTTLGVFSVMIGATLLLLPGVAADEVPSEQVTPTTSASETTEMEFFNVKKQRKWTNDSMEACSLISAKKDERK